MRTVTEEVVTFSTDVTALYPNLKAKRVAREIAEVYLEVELEIEVDIHQLGLYLLLVLGREEVQKQRLAKMCPTRKATAGAECGIGCNFRIFFLDLFGRFTIFVCYLN